MPLEDGDIGARSDFGEIYDRAFPKVYNYVRYRVHEPAVADDLTGKIFERVLEKLNTYKSEKAPFDVWLFTIARNTVNSHFRTLKWRSWLSLDWLETKTAGHEPGADDPLLKEEELRALLAAMKCLDARERDILALKFGSGLTNREIASMTGLSESHIGVIVYRSIKRLQEELNVPETKHE